MSGHSRWHNIQRAKGAADAKKGKIFTKFAREMAVAVREGGADPASNFRLAAVIARAKSENVPNDNINRILQKYQGGAAAENYEYITYEGYGPQGIAVIVETLTDNRNRTAGEVRHLFDKYGGNLGSTGCVAWQFDRKGVLIVEAGKLDADETMLLAIDAGAQDFEHNGEVFEIYTADSDFETVKSALESAGLSFLEAEIQMVPQNYANLTDESDVKNMTKMLELMEANDDVQNIWHNWDADAPAKT